MKRKDEATSIQDDLRRLHQSIGEAVQTCAAHGVGVHPSVVNKWREEIDRISKGLGL